MKEKDFKQLRMVLAGSALLVAGCLPAETPEEPGQQPPKIVIANDITATFAQQEQTLRAAVGFVGTEYIQGVNTPRKRYASISIGNEKRIQTTLNFGIGEQDFDVTNVYNEEGELKTTMIGAHFIDQLSSDPELLEKELLTLGGKLFRDLPENMKWHVTGSGYHSQTGSDGSYSRVDWSKEAYGVGVDDENRKYDISVNDAREASLIVTYNYVPST